MSAGRFAPGDRVRALRLEVLDHVREPRYVRGASGVVERVLGQFQNPATTAAGGDRTPEHWVYQVRFAAAELFGSVAHPRDSVYVDLWEHYLEPAEERSEA